MKKQVRSLRRTVFIRHDKCNGERGGETSEDSTGSQEEELTFSEVVHKKLLPLYLSIGVSEEKFWDSTPYDLEPYLDAYKLKQRQWDAQAWQYNMYTMCAVQTAVATVLVGKKSKAKYLDKPFLQDIQEEQEKGEIFLRQKRNDKEKITYDLAAYASEF